MNVSAIILCGGKERRFGGRNKFLASVGGCTVIDRVIGTLHPLSNQIILVTSPEKDITIGHDVRIVRDVYPGKGPLGGVYTGLVAADCEYAIVVGCDMPFLNSRILTYMLDIAPGFDIVVPRLSGRMVEPLHAVYARACAPILKARLESGALSISPLFSELKVRYLEKEEYLPLDPKMLSFFNINYPNDLERANRIAAEVDIKFSPHEG
jgi:molybdopterin-guanine dinucleotide biosynthesis protein A